MILEQRPREGCDKTGASWRRQPEGCRRSGMRVGSEREAAPKPNTPQPESPGPSGLPQRAQDQHVPTSEPSPSNLPPEGRAVGECRPGS